MFKWLAAGTAAAIAVPLALLLLVSATATPSTAATGLAGGPTAVALADIPPAYLALYLDAAQTCPGLPWGVLAGIGKVESDNGQSDAPGVHSGANFAGAEGPMQFEPATFAAVRGRRRPAGAAERVRPGGRDLHRRGDAVRERRRLGHAGRDQAGDLRLQPLPGLRHQRAGLGGPLHHPAPGCARPRLRSRSRWPRSASPTSGAPPARTPTTAPAWSTPPTPPRASTSPAPLSGGVTTARRSR